MIKCRGVTRRRGRSIEDQGSGPGSSISDRCCILGLRSIFDPRSWVFEPRSILDPRCSVDPGSSIFDRPWIVDLRWTLGPPPWILNPRSIMTIMDLRSSMGLGSRALRSCSLGIRSIMGPRSWVLDARWILDPRSSIDLTAIPSTGEEGGGEYGGREVVRRGGSREG